MGGVEREMDLLGCDEFIGRVNCRIGDLCVLFLVDDYDLMGRMLVMVDVMEHERRGKKDVRRFMHIDKRDMGSFMSYRRVHPEVDVVIYLGACGCDEFVAKRMDSIAGAWIGKKDKIKVSLNRDIEIKHNIRWGL